MADQCSLKAVLSIGRTSIKAAGTITSVLKFAAIDMHLGQY